jgi:hypothetical protein
MTTGPRTEDSHGTLGTSFACRPFYKMATSKKVLVALRLPWLVILDFALAETQSWKGNHGKM